MPEGQQSIQVGHLTWAPLRWVARVRVHRPRWRRETSYANESWLLRAIVLARITKQRATLGNRLDDVIGYAEHAEQRPHLGPT